MSRTDKTRPFEVALNDPHNRRYLKVGDDGTEKWTWKPLTSCKYSGCCYKFKQDKRKRSKKLQARKELRNLAVEDLYAY